MVEQLARTVAHCIVYPGVAIGVFEYFGCCVGALFPRGFVGEERRRNGRAVYRSTFFPFAELVFVGMPSASAVGHFVGVSLVVDIAYGEENLVFVRVVQYVVVHEFAFLVEEIEAQPPTF